MSENIHPNWQPLNELSLNAKTAKGGEWLRVEGLERELAVTLGHELTVHLDMNNGLYTPSSYYDGANFTLEKSLAEAEARAEDRQPQIFGEERPAGRNMAVRVQRGSMGTFDLAADVRNELEDRPDLQGGKILQLGFIAVVESLDLSIRT